jgi:hypothetical protein
MSADATSSSTATPIIAQAPSTEMAVCPGATAIVTNRL